MATFDYIKAVWKNGPGVVSDAPGWVLNAIERALPAWTFAHDREPVGVHLCEQSSLTLAIFVSPGAFGSAGLLEDSRHGSFIHVVATDHPGCASWSRDQARELFESVYGVGLSAAAVRQQRNFMLLDFPYHRELAHDLFVGKDRVEGGFRAEPPPAMGGAEVAAASPRDATVPPEIAEFHPPAESHAPLPLSSLLGTRARPTRQPVADGLPFDQGLSYEEVLARLRNRVYEGSMGEPETVVDRDPSPAVVAEEAGESGERSFESSAEALSDESDGPDPRLRAEPSGPAAAEARRDAPTAAVTGPVEPIPLSSLLHGHGGAASVADGPLSESRQAEPEGLEAIAGGLRAASRRASEDREEFDLGSFEGPRVPEPQALRAGRGVWPSIRLAAGLLLVLLIVGAVAARLSPRVATDAARVAPAEPGAITEVPPFDRAPGVSYPREAVEGGHGADDDLAIGRRAPEPPAARLEAERSAPPDLATGTEASEPPAALLETQRSAPPDLATGTEASEPPAARLETERGAPRDLASRTGARKAPPESVAAESGVAAESARASVREPVSRPVPEMVAERAVAEGSAPARVAEAADAAPASASRVAMASAPEAAAAEPELDRALADGVGEAEGVDGETSSARVELEPTTAEPGGGEEAANATASTGTEGEVAVAPTGGDVEPEAETAELRTARPREGRQRRERQRVMSQIKRYR